MAREKWERSSGNIFIDLGASVEEAASLTIRSELMGQLRDMIKRRKLTQAAAAKLLGVTQPRISNLTRGKIDLFSIDTLVEMVCRAGGEVKMDVRGLKRVA